MCEKMQFLDCDAKKNFTCRNMNYDSICIAATFLAKCNAKAEEITVEMFSGFKKVGKSCFCSQVSQKSAASAAYQSLRHTHLIKDTAGMPDMHSQHFDLDSLTDALQLQSEPFILY